MKFVKVDPADIPNLRDTHRGRVSYPILKSFMETNEVCLMLDRTGIPQTLSVLSSCLGAYVKSHGMPIKLFTRDGELYLLRMDLNLDGTPNPDYAPPTFASRKASLVAPEDLRDLIGEAIEVVDSASAAVRYEKAKGKVPK